VLEVTTLRWALTIGLVVGLLALDLGRAAAWPHVVGFREAALSSVFYIAVAIVFGVVFIALGAALLELFSFVFLIFGLVLIVTGP